MFIRSLDQPLTDNGGCLHDIIGRDTDRGGRKPLPLKSSWMMHDRPIPPPRKTKVVFFLDDLVTGHSLCQAATMDQARAAQRELKAAGYRTLIREYRESEATLQAEESLRRHERQLGYR
jgi:hypothetical protein